MTIGLISPMLQVLEDQRVTTGEIGWLIQQSLEVIMTAVAMATLFKMIEGAIE